MEERTEEKGKNDVCMLMEDKQEDKDKGKRKKGQSGNDCWLTDKQLEMSILSSNRGIMSNIPES